MPVAVTNVGFLCVRNASVNKFLSSPDYHSVLCSHPLPSRQSSRSVQVHGYKNPLWKCVLSRLCVKQTQTKAQSLHYSQCLLLCEGERGVVVERWSECREVTHSNPPSCRLMDLSLVVPNSTSPRLVNSQIAFLLPVGIFNKLLLTYDICLLMNSVLN